LKPREGTFPGTLGVQLDMSGYELPIGIDIFRGRYRTSFSQHAASRQAGSPILPEDSARSGFGRKPGCSPQRPGG
jgi:hypothetical protein